MSHPRQTIERPIGCAGACHPDGWPACELTYTLGEAALDGQGHVCRHPQGGTP